MYRCMLLGRCDCEASLGDVFSAEHGVGSLKVSFVCGNYHKKDGFGFGGVTRTKSVNEIKRLAEELGLSKAERFVMMDVHTGVES